MRWRAGRVARWPDDSGSRGTLSHNTRIWRISPPCPRCAPPSAGAGSSRSPRSWMAGCAPIAACRASSRRTARRVYDRLAVRAWFRRLVLVGAAVGERLARGEPVRFGRFRGAGVGPRCRPGGFRAWRRPPSRAWNATCMCSWCRYCSRTWIGCTVLDSAMRD
jgi:hypothetical protein